MQKKIVVPVSIAVFGFVAGGIMLGSLGASAHGGEGFERGNKGEIAAEVLGVDVEELKDLRGSGVTFENFVLDNGFDSIDDFHEAMLEGMAEQWAEDGLSEDEIEEKLNFMRERHQFGETQREIVEDLLGLSHEEWLASKEDGQTREDLIEAAGYESTQEFREAVDEALEEAGIERPDHGFGHGHKHGGFGGGHHGF